MRGRCLLALVLTMSAGAASAAPMVIFSDNFNADLRGRNKTTFVGGWTVGNGTVDVIGEGPGNEPGAGPGQSGDATNENLVPGHGNYIDLDGTTNDPGDFRKLLTLSAGVTYQANFSLAGSQRGGTESVLVTFGNTVQTFVYARLQPFSASQLVFTPTTTGSYALTFSELGAIPSNNQGLLLDDVLIGTGFDPLPPVVLVSDGSVLAVPEPGMLPLMGVAFAALVAVAGRRRREP